ncbi:MAG: exodeoxyribonuclease III [Gammaproteobacteria bacterium]|nr:exodeoxyribonuclease III [Gammaproteobacteria bacterium]
MKIASWNVNSLKVRLPHVLQWLDEAKPDVLGLQETKTIDEKFPEAEISEAGYHVVYAGQKTYNGVALITKEPATEVFYEIPGIEDTDKRTIGATVNGVRVVNLYVVNGQEVGAEKYDYKLAWLEHVRKFVEAQQSEYQDIAVMGDFNIAPGDADIHDPEAWREKILCSTLERDALQRLLDLGFVDTFRLFDQAPGSFSWWDYRAAGFRRNKGLRIDLVLASNSLSERCVEAGIDVEPRRLERPSDHTPVFARFGD